MAGKRPDPTKRSEEEFPARYRSERYPGASVAVDVVILTVVDVDLKILLVQRKEHPFRGVWALPGGFVDVGDGAGDRGEDLDRAAARVLAAKTGLPATSLYLEQLYTFGKARRDPRARILSVAYYALVRPDLVPFVEARESGAEGGEPRARWTPVSQVERMTLAFDHQEIVAMALGRIRGKVDYTDIAFSLVPSTFTIAELRSVWEVIKAEAHDPGNFRRRFGRMLEDSVIEKAPGRRITVSRPAAVYRFRRPGGEE
jgi:8-oxo-dGTP diphosphatase